MGAGQEGDGLKGSAEVQKEAVKMTERIVVISPSSLVSDRTEHHEEDDKQQERRHEPAPTDRVDTRFEYSVCLTIDVI